MDTLNLNEQAVLSFIDASAGKVSIKDIASQVFPYLTAFQANSWTRNSLRRLRDVFGLVKKVERGRYESTLPPVQRIAQTLARQVEQSPEQPVVETQPTIRLEDYQSLIHHAVYKTAPGLNEEDRADLVQEVNARILVKLDKFDPAKSKPQTWIFHMAHNLTVDVLRSRSRKPLHVSFDTAHDVSDPSVIEEAVEHRQSAALLYMALAKLPEDERTFVGRIFADDASVAEMAVQMGVSTQTIYKRKAEIVSKLRGLVGA